MKTVIMFVVVALCHALSYAQGVLISDVSGMPDSTAILELRSSSKGFLMTRLSTVQRDSIQSPTQSLMIYNTTNSRYEYFDGTAWVPFVAPQQQEKPYMLPQADGFTFESVYMDRYCVLSRVAGGTPRITLVLDSTRIQSRNTGIDWPVSASGTSSAVVLNGSLYILIRSNPSPTENRVYRYDLYNLNAGGTQVSVSGGLLLGTAGNVLMSCDGTDFYFTRNAGNNAQGSNVIAKYSLSGPNTLVYQGSTTYGFVNNAFARFCVDSGGNMYGYNSGTLVKYSSTGSLDYQLQLSSLSAFINWGGTMYVQLHGDDSPVRIVLE